jgi:hypothetical protein
MAPKKKPTMLQRQRALRQQQQKTKQQSSRQLPPGKKGGSVTKPGGAMAKSGAAKPSSPRTSAPVEQVRVRDLGSSKPKQMTGGSQRALPPGRQGGAMARVARTAATTAGKVGGAGKALPVVGTLLTAAGEVSAMADRQKRWDDYKRRTGLDKKTPAQTGGTRRGGAAGSRTDSSAKPTKPPLSSTGVRTPKGNTVATGSPEYNRYRQAQLDANKKRNTQVRDTTPSRQAPTQSGGGSTQSRSGGSGSSTMPRVVTQQSPEPKTFKGSVSEGRRIWAEKYSSSKYNGQAIQKEAKALLEKMKKEKNNSSAASKAGWDGNKNY